MDWFSVEWFRVETFQAFSWENFWYLYFIPAIPLVFVLRWAFHIRFRQKLQVSLPEGDFGFSWINWLRFIPRIFFGFSLVFILIALARPQRNNDRIEYSSEGIDIMLVLDISESMLEKDFQPNRLEVAKQVARDFIKGRFRDRIGIVVFSGEAYSLMPLTTDYGLLYQAINDIQYNLIKSEGTAIGSALAVMTNRMKESNAKTKVAVLISDGDNTVGNIDPVTASELAYMYGVKVYTIAMAAPMAFSTPADTILQNSDETTLQKIASTCEGEFFRATDNRSLKNIFNKINLYEKSEIKEMKYQEARDYYTVYLTWAIIFLLVWLFLKSTFMNNLLED